MHVTMRVRPALTASEYHLALMEAAAARCPLLMRQLPCACVPVEGHAHARRANNCRRDDRRHCRPLDSVDISDRCRIGEEEDAFPTRARRPHERRLGLRVDG